VLEIENGKEIDDSQRSPTFENFIQGIHNIDAAMEAMIDNYTDGVEHVGAENGLDSGEHLIDKIQRGTGYRSRPTSAIDITI
jgi:hypothetical protein